MSSGDQNYKEACINYEKGELGEAIKLFNKAIDYYYLSNWENKNKVKAYYYRGCTYYRLGIQCERNQMFEESEENFEKALKDFEEVSEKIKELFPLNYYAGCTYYKLGMLYEKKRMSDKAHENFKNALTYLEIISKYAPYKENGKLWFYKGIAEYKNKNSSEYFESLRKAVTYDYYDIEIFRELLHEDLIHGDSQKNNSMHILLLYYLKRYSDVIKYYSNDLSHKKCLDNLINDYGFEGTYYCALSHYEFKDFKRSFEILNKLISLSEVIKNCESFKNEIDKYRSKNKELPKNVNDKLDKIYKNIDSFIKDTNEEKSDCIPKFNEIKKSSEELIPELNKKWQYSYHELSKLIDNIKEFCKKNEGIKTCPIFTDKLIPNSWYYKGLILYELRNNFKDQELLKAVFDGFDLVPIEDNDKEEFKRESQKFVNNKDGKNLKEYILWDVDKKTKFVKYLNNSSNIEPKKEEILQRIFDIESQIAFEEALNKYNEIIDSSQTFELYYYKALVLDELKRYKEAIESLDEFLKNKPRDAKAWLKKGTILFKIAKDEGIKTTFEEPKTENENEKISCEKEITRIKAAKDALKKSICHIKIDEAIETTSEEPKTENENEKISCEKEITKIDAAKNALDKSIWYFKILIDENPGNPDHWYNMGTAHSSLAEVLIKTRDYQGALNEYEEAVKAFDYATTLNPNFALAWNNKGNAYMKLKKYNKAIEAFEKAFEINPNYYLALHNKGDSLYCLGKYKEAIKIYDQIIYDENGERELDPNVYKSWNDKGLALYKLERYDEAVKTFDKALDINPTFADGYINKGLVFYKLEMLSEAKKAFEEALELELGDFRASNNLGVVLAIEGELDRAKKLFENTIQENPDFILAHANLAELLLNSGGIEEASKNIKNIQIDDKNPDPNMGYIHFLDGRIKIEDMERKEKKYSDAAKSFEKAASFNVDEPTFLLWSVYAKYLCQKFETGGKANSSEESKTGEEKIPSKTEDICSNELSNSIECDLGKVLNFCNTPAIKKNSLHRLLNQNLLWEIVLTIIILYGLFYLFDLFDLFETLEPDIPNVSNIQISHYLYLIAIGLILLVILFDRKLRWPIIAITSMMILLFVSYPFDTIVLSFALLIATLLIILLKLLDWRSVWSIPIIVTIVIISLFGLYSFLLFIPLKETIISLFGLYGFLLFAHLISTIILLFELYSFSSAFLLAIIITILSILLYYRSTLRIQIKAKEYLIKFDRYKEIKAYALYLQGYFYFKLQDYTTAKEKLKECINLRPDARTDKAAKELLDNIWKHKIKPPFWTYWFNSPVNTWRRRVFSTFVILGILSILFVHAENPQPVDWNNSTSKDYIPREINFYPYIISYSNNTTSDLTGSLSNDNNANDENENDNNNINNNVTWNILIPASMNIYPDIPDNYFDAILLLILILILISPSIRITETAKMILKGGDVSLELGPIAAPPEFNFELSPSLMLDVIKRLDENL